MTQEAFIKILDKKRYSYEIEGDKIVVTHKGKLNLDSLTSIPYTKFFSYQITTDALYNEDDSCFREKDAKIFANIEQKLRERQTEFNTYIMELEKLKKRYPEERRIYNLLGVCYGKKKDSRKTFEVLTEQYKKFPDYLFAKVNLATWMIFGFQLLRVALTPLQFKLCNNGEIKRLYVTMA